MIMNVYWYSRKERVILVKLQWNLNFVDRFMKNTEIPYFIKIRPVITELFHADGRTDREGEANNCFS